MVVDAAIPRPLGQAASAHPPNAAGQGADRYRRVARELRTCAAIGQQVAGQDPLVMSRDAPADHPNGVDQTAQMG